MNLDLICFYRMFLRLPFLHGTLRTLENFANQGNGVIQGHPVSQAGLKPQDIILSLGAIIMYHFPVAEGTSSAGQSVGGVARHCSTWQSSAFRPQCIRFIIPAPGPGPRYHILWLTPFSFYCLSFRQLLF